MTYTQRGFSGTHTKKYTTRYEYVAAAGDLSKDSLKSRHNYNDDRDAKESEYDWETNN